MSEAASEGIAGLEEEEADAEAEDEGSDMVSVGGGVVSIRSEALTGN